MRAVYVGFLILATLVGLFIGYYIWVPTWQIPHEFRYDILKDTLFIVLAVLAVGIGAIGYAVYQILSGRLQTESASASRVEMTRGSARLFTHLGYVFWGKYKRTDKKERQYLDVAIDITEHGLRYMSELPEKKRENEILLCHIRNNLAYYLAERKNVEDKKLAKDYIEYIQKRIQKYPTYKAAWLDTCNFVRQQYPD